MNKKISRDFDWYIFKNYMLFNAMVLMALMVSISNKHIFFSIIVVLSCIYCNWADTYILNKLKKELQKLI